MVAVVVEEMAGATVVMVRVVGVMLRPFLIGNEHERCHEHSKHRYFLIDLASTSWCLDFARTLFTAVFGSKSRHPKRSGI